MRKNKAVIAVLLAGSFLALSASGASARWYHRRGPGPVLGLVGVVVVGAAAIATLPFQILGAAVNPAPRRGYGYYAAPPDAYPPPPPRYYRQPYGPPPGDYGGRY